MATSPNNVNRKYDGGIFFAGGVNSFLHPSLIAKDQISWGINVTNIGGILSTRPGFDTLLNLGLSGKAQGLTVFTPTGSLPYIVAAVSGKIYVSPFPFIEIQQLGNIQFHPNVDQIVFQDTLQVSDKGKLVDPKAILIMQDGRTRPAMWDGTINRHTLPGGTTQETVIGLWMAWIGGRLWVALGNQVFAGDIGDPLHFTETQYLAIGGSLQPLDGLPVTAMARTADSKSLLIFTNENTTIVQASITDRSVWKSTPDFISLLFPGVGCVAGKSPVYLDGELWWFSKEGARRFTQVSAALQVSKNSLASNEMLRSFDNMSPTASNACGMSFGKFIGFSVPSGDIYNRHTWVLSDAIESLLNSNSAAAWQGIWMGTRPVQWVTADINGTDRCFFLSQDKIGGVNIWEAFNPNQKDNDQLIYCSIEGNGLLFGEPLNFKRFQYTAFFLTQVLGEVTMSVEYRGDFGCWKLIFDADICAQDCNQLNCTDQNMAPSPQNRFYRTQQSKEACQTKEGPYSEDIGTFFQNRFRWYGINGIYKYQSQANQWEEPAIGQCFKGDTACVPKLCCDEEVDYIAIPNINPYPYGSGNGITTSL